VIREQAAKVAPRQPATPEKATPDDSGVAF
jgi:hypothetical protein